MLELTIHIAIVAGFSLTCVAEVAQRFTAVVAPLQSHPGPHPEDYGDVANEVDDLKVQWWLMSF